MKPSTQSSPRQPTAVTDMLLKLAFKATSSWIKLPLALATADTIWWSKKIITFPSDHHHPSVASSYSSLQTVYSNKNRSIWCRDKHKTLAVLFRDTGLLKQLTFSWSHSGFCYAPQWAQKGSTGWPPLVSLSAPSVKPSTARTRASGTFPEQSKSEMLLMIHQCFEEPCMKESSIIPEALKGGGKRRRKIPLICHTTSIWEAWNKDNFNNIADQFHPKEILLHPWFPSCLLSNRTVQLKKLLQQRNSVQKPCDFHANQNLDTLVSLHSTRTEPPSVITVK